MKLMSVINEMVTKEKDLFGRGAWHLVYPSKNNPDIVYKIGFNLDIMKQWVGLFNEHPDFFPKTYGNIKESKFNIKGFNGKVIEKKTGYYIAVEKLDTKSFLKFWNEIDLIFLPRDFQQFLRYFKNYDMDEIYNLAEKVKTLKPEFMDQFIEFVNLVDSIYEIKPSSDLHRNQFGIDKEGKMKCLDL
jgi:hypothetical protein